MKAIDTLFRGKRIDNGEWVYGYFVMVDDTDTFTQYPCIVSKKNTLSHGRDITNWHQVYTDSVGQFTGFRTVNQSLVYDESKDIYGGDIFKLTGSDVRYVVNMRNGRWIGESSDGDDWGKFSCEICSVRKSIILLGNITDDPELLK